jgi:hypothetical protein
LTVFNIARPLIDDRQQMDSRGRFLDYILKIREEGAPVIGLYCGYAPGELTRAMGTRAGLTKSLIILRRE